MILRELRAAARRKGEDFGFCGLFAERERQPKAKVRSPLAQPKLRAGNSQFFAINLDARNG
jgi:hypothetical protein